MVNITPAPVAVPEAVIAKVAEGRVTLRRQHGVRLVDGAEEGEILKYMSGGLYGFTYAPQSLDCGLFSKNPYLSFEVHKQSDNTIKLLGVVTPEVKAKIAAATDLVEIEFYPDAYRTASELVVLPFAQLRHMKAPNRDEGNKIKCFYQPV
ncbi:MAG TPA: hypothetical protein VFQ91_29240 [Bryobacteraceae bacterium]|nr:hypothetical protein [Bryobacteraceae bacterium]